MNEKILTSMFLAAFCYSSLLADVSELSISVGPSDVELSWLTENDFYYFIQKSETLEVGSWTYESFATKGDSLVRFVSADSSPLKQFFRLEFYDPAVSPLPAVLTANFDGDLADNKTELDQGTDLFGLTFSDADSLFDEWEFSFFGDLSQSDAGNDDLDFTNNLEESQLGLDPMLDEKGLALTYTYDDLGRLTAVSGNATAVSYTLDEEGNIRLSD